MDSEPLYPIAIEWWDSEGDEDRPWVDRDEVIKWAQEPRSKEDVVVTVALMVGRTKDSICIVHTDAGGQLSPPMKVPMIAVKRLGTVTIDWESDPFAGPPLDMDVGTSPG